MMVFDEKLRPSLNCQCHVPPRHNDVLVFFRIQVCISYLPDSLRQPTTRLSPWYSLLSCETAICTLESITGESKESAVHQNLDMTLKGSGNQKSVEETTTEEDCS